MECWRPACDGWGWGHAVGLWGITCVVACAVLCCVRGVVFVWWLRTVQWMRVSLLLYVFVRRGVVQSCVVRSVDALAPRADEGRSRLR